MALQGISDKTIDTHLSLYEGYVKATNALQGRIAEFLKDGHVDQEEFPGLFRAHPPAGI